MLRLQRKMVLTWTSGVLCTLAVLFWIRGIWAVDDLTLMTPYHAISLVNADGGLHIARLLFDFTQPDWMTEQRNSTPQPATGWNWDYRRDDAAYDVEYVASQGRLSGKWGFGFTNGWHAPRWNSESTPDPTGWMVRIPWWPIVLLTGFLPAAALIAWARKETPRRKGYCPKCGYDLRATPRRCPECGYVLLLR
jgi:hypothetical protein